MIAWLEKNSLDIFRPTSALGTVFYAAVFLFAATLSAAFLRASVNKILKKDAHRRIDRTYAIFLTKLGVVGIYGLFIVLYAHLIPSLHSLATLLLTEVSVISLVLGLAAQNTLGNIVAGIAILFYRPFLVGDTIIVAIPGGSEKGVVEQISLGYTILLAKDNRQIMVPNGVALAQTIIKLPAAENH